MIKKIVLYRFKQFKDTEIDLRSGLSFLVGGNNSGKSSILQAMAIWEFCKTIVEIEKGHGALLKGAGSLGIGIGDDEFTPINVPSLKHLWTNLTSQKVSEEDGYTLKIKLVWEDSSGNDLFLQFGLALANDRLFIKTSDSNLEVDHLIPRLAFLPPFAGITDKETRLTPAMRNRLVGQGLSGGVIRNVLYDMLQKNQEERNRLKGTRDKLTTPELRSLRNTDPWEILCLVLHEVFQRQVTVNPFNDRYHSYIRVEAYKSIDKGGRIQKLQGYNARDLMVEGSGFLQWLSVYALLLSPDYQLVLLDEPDAHLHSALQSDLVNRLRTISAAKSKQILLATHSAEIIKSAVPTELLQVARARAQYLSAETQKIALLAGIGTEYSPRIHKLQVHKKLLLIEGESDERLIRKWMEVSGWPWPNNVLVWQWPAGHKERKQLFIQLKNEIPKLIALSMRDRDDESEGSVAADLIDKDHQAMPTGFTALKWRRRNIENYLLAPAAIARATNKPVSEITSYFQTKHALAIPVNYMESDVAAAIRDARGKSIYCEGADSIESCYYVTREQVARAMNIGEIADDVKTFLTKINELSSS